MCGRYAVTTAPEAMRALFRYLEQPNFPPRYNVAPTQPVGIVRMVEGRREFALVRWGLIPAWVKDPRGFSLLINARGESALDKPAFRNAMKRRRCLFPADGFYEWKRDGYRKQPYFVRLKSGQPMAFAGLWETWSGPNGEETGDRRDRDHGGEPLDRAYPRPHAGDRRAGSVRLLARPERGRADRRGRDRAGARCRAGGV